jgi:hypothetical protein
MKLPLFTSGRWSRVGLLFLLLRIPLLLGCEPGPLPSTGSRSVEAFDSVVLGERFLLRVRLPPSYELDPERSYPLLVQLDPTFAGLRQLDYTLGFLSEMERSGEAPESIVVGLDYPEPFDRFRDYPIDDPLDPELEGEGADQLYKVLRDELLPHLDATLRARPTERYLVGHSLGGAFALYAAFRREPEGPLFTGLLANDPTYGPSHLELEARLAEQTEEQPLRLYRAAAVDNGPVHLLAHRWITERLAGRAYRGLEFHQEVFDTSHGGIIPLGTESGLRFLFGGAE